MLFIQIDLFNVDFFEPVKKKCHQNWVRKKEKNWEGAVSVERRPPKSRDHC